MSSVVTYKNTERQCFCQIKFDSGERVLISIASMPVPSVKVIRMGFGGFIPRDTIWEYSAAKAGTSTAYVENVMKMFTPVQSVDLLDCIRDVLLPCRSLDECRSALASRQDLIHRTRTSS